MSGFAGSQRAGERRRRRLAVESEGSEAESPRTPGEGDPLLHFYESAGREASQLTPRNCPILTVVSAPSWKHWVVVLLGLTLLAGVLAAGFTYPQWATEYGPGVARLFGSQASTIIGWAVSLMLFTTAQAAWIIWWARSRSLRDFGGRYRIWGWAAATWLLFSFASATQAHLAWSETVLHYIRWRTQGASLWCWLLPASAWGWGLALRLEQELREDRPAHWLFLTAGAWYLGVVGILCQIEFWPQACPAETSQLLLAAAQLLGHGSLFLSTSLHARYVLLFTAEPPAARRRTQSKTGELGPIRSSWLRMLWPAWLFRSRAAAEAEEADEEDKPKRGRKRSTSKRRLAQRKSSRVSRSADLGDDTEETPEEEWDGESGELPADDSQDQPGAKRYRVDTAESLAGEHYGDSDDDDSDGPKGLSKRDRRKLQQQMREQERQGRR